MAPENIPDWGTYYEYPDIIMKVEKFGRSHQNVYDFIPPPSVINFQHGRK